MKLTEMIVQDNMTKIAEKHVLEIACGEAGISAACSEYAATVVAADVKLDRLGELPDGVRTVQMDARHVDRFMGIVDTVICYNGIGHMSDVLSDVIDAVMNRTDVEYFLILNTWKMDKMVAYDILLPLLAEKRIKYSINENATYQGIVIKR